MYCSRDKDFKKMNALGLKKGAFDSKKTYQFRKETECLVKPERRRDLSLRLPPIDFTYGLANKPATPIHGVVHNHYGESATNSMQEKYQLQLQLKKQTRNSN
mmetsp:Transcript_13651/g.9818  ORF Transcript_13651/g.9818 Transcript_13651/m.9818 type:complete len:102 (+) Transcript_13651:175-480(+)